ncbi:MAG: hypothetical protein M3R41_06930 [Pseudomonadota bacterium]|nr:hypothetical protein [Pseudomonadota bacterium]
MTVSVPTSRWATAALLLAFAIAVRACDFGNPVIHVDEQYYLLVGDRMLHGAWPYIDVWDRKPIGLFALFAAIRLLPGDGILAYQLVATLFVAATAWLVHRAARQVGAAQAGAWFAAAACVIWPSLLSGRGGQSPIFYGLFVCAAALLTLRLPVLAARIDRRGIVLSGMATCFLAGLAIQTKYTAAVEGAFFGIVHLFYLRRAGAHWPTIFATATGWLVIGLAPTLIAIGVYAAHGPAALRAFWFANFESIFLRSHYTYPARLIAERLLGIVAQLSPLAIGAGVAMRRRGRNEAHSIAVGWLIAAFVGFAVLGTYFDHYALPLIAPLAVVAAPAFGRHRRLALVALALALATMVVKQALRHDDRAGAYALAQVVAANSGEECPYIFAGDAITYHLAHVCLPTAYAFPSTLAYAPEQGATGINEAGEVARILARRPPVIVMGDRPLAAWNEASHAEVVAALARDYRPVFSVPREDYRLVAYLRRDRAFKTTGRMSAER